jgi:DNA-binding MarR family transcriptional regulator
MIAAMDGLLPLPTLLSHVLVAFTIELDNEAEQQMRHRTTRHGSKDGSLHAPWLVSVVMWSNCMQFVDEQGVSVCELERRARTKTNLAGMQRWGYIVVEPDPADHRPKPPSSAWLVRATPAGRKAQEIWRPLVGVMESRWQERFGTNEIAELRESLWAVASRLDVVLPECLPILGYGLFSRGEYQQRAGERHDNRTDLPLPLAALLSRVLLAFAIEFESESDLSLAISANVVRVLDEKGVPVRDLPLLTGVSKEAIAVSLSFLTKRGYAVVEAEQNCRRTKFARLNSKGRESQTAYRQLLDVIEKRWQTRFGKETIRSLRKSLEPLVGDPTAQLSPLFRGLDPHPDGWRASVRKPNTLPHYPMVLHRGGYPDGS